MLRIFSMKMTDSHDYNWLQILSQAEATINTVLTMFPLGFVTWYTITVIKKYPCLGQIELTFGKTKHF